MNRDLLRILQMILLAGAIWGAIYSHDYDRDIFNWFGGACLGAFVCTLERDQK